MIKVQTEFVRGDYINISDIDGVWKGGWYCPNIPDESKKYVLQAIRGAHRRGCFDTETKISRALGIRKQTVT